MRSAFITTLLLSSTIVLSQDSTSTDSLFTIQTSPPTPSDSLSSAFSTGSVPSNSGSSASIAGSTTSSGSASTATSTSPAQFPQVCANNCSAASNALSTCGTGTLNTTCLCTSEIEQSYLECVECALSLNPSPALVRSYQALIDSYIEQCASAEENPVTLSNVTVTLPSTSAPSGSGSVSISGSSNSASATSSASRSGSSVFLPSSMVSHPPLSSSSIASAAASASSSGAAKSSRGEIKMPLMVAGVSLGMVFLGGVLVL